MKAGAVVVGQVARDLVVRVERLPAPGRATTVARRIERLGGKGANHALGLHQLGLAVALVGVVGTDHAGDDVLHEADTEGLDVAGVVRRGETALLIDVTDDDGRRLLEDVPSDALLRPEDVERTASLFDDAAVVSLQLQQPTDAVLTAAHLAAEAGARIVLDGATEDDGDELLALADVVRADATEAAMWAGTTIRERADAARVTRSLLERGPSLAAVTVPGQGTSSSGGPAGCSSPTATRPSSTRRAGETPSSPDSSQRSRTARARRRPGRRQRGRRPAPWLAWAAGPNSGTDHGRPIRAAPRRPSVVAARMAP